MTTQENTPQTPATAKSTAPKSISIRLTAGVEEVLISAYATKTGWTSQAVRYREPAVKGKKRTGERGATQEHANLAAARAAVEKLAASFVKAGWTRPEPKAFGGFARKQDAFGLNNLPRPGKK
jgi:hypothetical protein